MEYRKDIQGLRAIAVLSVFLFHINSHWLPGGFTGVDIFFVISGYLISSIILKNRENNTFNFIGFYMSRFRRIVPAYYFMLVCVVIAAAFIFIGNDIFQIKRSFLRALVFDSDRLQAQGGSYFDVPTKFNPLVHAWTIGVEMKFYFLLPAVLMFTRKKYHLPVVTSIAVCCFAYGMYQLYANHAHTSGYYSFVVRIAEFCVGVLLVLLKDRLCRVSYKFRGIAGITGIVLLVLSAFFIDGHSYFPTPLALLPCAGTALLILYSAGPVYSLLSCRVLEFTGSLSYSIYLWHVPVITFLRYYTGRVIFTYTELLFIIIATFALSWLSYTYIENYFRRKGKVTFVMGMLPLAALAVLLYFKVPVVNSYFSKIPLKYSAPVFGLNSHGKNYVETFGDTTKTPEILLIGNSHALCIKPCLDYIGKKNNFSFRTITSNSYPAIEGIDEKDISGNGRIADYKQSQLLVQTTQKEIQRSKIIILVSSSWKIVPSMANAVKQLSAGLAPGQHLVLMTPFPVVDKDPLRINRDFIKDNSKKQQYKIKRTKMNEELLGLKDKYPQIHFLDFSGNEIFNNAPFYRDTIMYYNKTHINSYGALVLAKQTEKQFVNFLDSIR